MAKQLFTGLCLFSGRTCRVAAAAVLLVAWATPWRAAAQAGASADSVSLALVVAAAKRLSTQTQQPEARLLSGTEYVNYSRPNSTGHQFFQSSIAQPGSINFDGQLFTDVPLLYDLRRDKVLTPLPGRETNLQLLAEKATSFTLGGHQFVRLVAADTTAAMPTGFYDLLLASEKQGVLLLARRTKRETQEPVAGHLAFGYEEKSRLFLQKGTVFTEVTTLKQILQALPERKADLQKFARSNHLRFNDEHREEAATAVLRYYNTLVP
jgi:hypothetical protein